LTNQETVIQESRSLSSSQEDQIFCIWTRDTTDVEKSAPSYQWIQTEVLLSPNTSPTRDFINNHCTKSRKHYPGEDLRFRRQGNELQYLVKWQEQPFEESMWEDRREVIKGGVMSRITQKVTASHPNAPEFDRGSCETISRIAVVQLVLVH